MKQLLLLFTCLSICTFTAIGQQQPTLFNFKGKEYYIYPLRIDKYLPEQTFTLKKTDSSSVDYMNRIVADGTGNLKIPSMDLRLPDGEYVLFYANQYSYYSRKRTDEDTTKVFAAFVIQQGQVEGPASFYAYYSQLKTDSGYFKQGLREGVFYSFGYVTYGKKLKKRLGKASDRIMLAETPYQNDQLQGAKKEYFMYSRSLRELTHYEQDNKVGENLEFFDNGNISYRRNFAVFQADSIPPEGYMGSVSEEVAPAEAEAVLPSSVPVYETYDDDEYNYSAASSVLHGDFEDFYGDGTRRHVTRYFYGNSLIADTVFHKNGTMKTLRYLDTTLGLPYVTRTVQFDTSQKMLSETWTDYISDRTLQSRRYSSLDGTLYYEMPYIDLTRLGFDSLYRYSVAGTEATGLRHEIWKIKGSGNRHVFHRIIRNGAVVMDFKINEIDSTRDYLNWSIILQDTLKRVRLENQYSHRYHGMEGFSEEVDLRHTRRYRGETTTYYLTLDGQPFTGTLDFKLINNYLEEDYGLKPQRKIKKDKLELVFDGSYDMLENLRSDEPYTRIIGTWVNGRRDGAFLFYKGNQAKQWSRKAHFRSGVYHGPILKYDYENIEERPFMQVMKMFLPQVYSVATLFGPVYEGKEEYLLKEGSYDGPAREYYRVGRKWKIKESYGYKEGYLDGPLQEYSRNGKLLHNATYVEGYLNGTEESFFYDGSKRYTKVYDHGVADGKWISFNREGNLEQELNLQKGYLVGESKTYYNTQVLQMSLQADIADSNRYFSYKDLGNYTGSYQYFYNNTIRSAAGRREKGDPVGKWQYWDENGNLSKMIEYRVGKIKPDSLPDSLEYIGQITSWYPNVFKKAEGYIISQDFKYDCTQDRSIPVEDLYWVNAWQENGEPMVVEGQGTIKTYHLNKNLESEGEVSKGLMNGVWRFYDPNGNLTAIGLYVNGKKQGRWLSGDLGGLGYINDKCFESPEAFELTSLYNREVVYTETWYEDGKKVKEEEITLYR